MDTLSYIPIATSPATPGIWTLFNGEVEQNPMDRAMESRSVTADPRIYSGANGNTVTFNAAGTPTRPFNRSRLSQHSGGGSNTTSPMPSPNINNGGNSSNNNAALASNGGMETPPLLSPGARQSTNGLSNGSHGSLRISSSLAQSAMHTQSTPSPKVRPSSPLLPNRTSITAPSPKMPPSNLVSSSVISNGLTEKSSNGGTNTSAGIDQRPSSTRKKGVRLSNAPTLKERMNSMSTTAASKSGFVFPPIKVLIVEDNPINQTILSTFLRKRKIEYAVASDGQEAVDMWKQGGFHIVLMDIQLPVLDGIEATKEIRRFEKERKAAALPPPDSPGEVSVEQRRLATQMHTPVIIVALTASALQADRNTALAAGCNDFLTKPVSLPWLEKKITEWGCMQALINVTGWSRWRRQDSASTISIHGRGGSGAGTPSPANVSRSNSEKKP
ncbi:hypothetical protein BDF19DRAFT_421910 [Syncephalis fuscata]|nr:hypothetical protein BDF19DRAFT_421910 [Syncephalis fuscata]